MTAPLFFGGEISQKYEDYLGPFLFEPYAIDLAARLNLTGVSNILELACGSGRLTKHIAAILPPGADFTATDLNTDMISIAKSKVTSDRVIWATADMLDLPCENESFDLVVCQFGIMLVPDQQKALSEIFRVLKTGGKIVFSTWSDVNYNRLWAIADTVMIAVLGKSMIGSDPGPFAMGDENIVLARLKGVGFGKSTATLVKFTGETESAAKAAHGFIYGLPVGLYILKEAPDLMPEVLKILEEKLQSELGDQPLKAPMAALVFESTK